MRKPANKARSILHKNKKKQFAEERLFAQLEKGVCIIGGESEALGFHQETTEESRKQQDRFCIKTLHYIFMRLHS